jgi:transcription-repair coupling factor (superfamily II helicase)
VDALRAGRGLDLDEPEHHKPEINLHVPALLPDDYMPDVHLRLVHYKRIASAPDTKTLNRLKVELIDRFGVLPTATRNLFRLSELRLECDPRGIRRIEANEHGITVEFGADTRVPPETLVNLVTRHSELYRLDKQMRLRFSHDLEDVEERFVAVEELLIKLDCTPESPNSTTTGAGHNGI